MKATNTLLLAFSIALSSPAVGQVDGNQQADAAPSFESAMEALMNGASRSEVAAMFGSIKTLPDGSRKERAKELAGHLDAMAVEDQSWVEPESVDAFSADEKIAYYIYHLRDFVGYGVAIGAPTNAVSPSNENQMNPARELVRLGDAAVPALLDLLDDPRPTRAVWRFKQSRYWSVLRYQDVAVQVLGEIAPAQFYRPSNTSVYFSLEVPSKQEEIKRQYREWSEKARGKTGVERLWAAIDTVVGIYPTLSVLEELAFEHGQRGNVFMALQVEMTRRPRIQLPQLSFLMCRLGHTEYMKEALEMWKSRPRGRHISLPDDGAATSNAESYLYRQLILYGDAPHHAYLTNVVHGREREQFDLLVHDMCNIATNRWGWLIPEEYDLDRFPIHLLIDAMNAETVVNPKRTRERRLIDEVALAIQSFTEIDFGMDAKAPVEKRDAAIARINAWWQEQEQAA